MNGILYMAHTFDSGQTWTTIDATPTDPVQRGCIWMQGGSNPCRNLLDFMGQAVDKEGRVLVGYADGCLNCSSSSTSHSKKATIARQVNGRRLFAAYDPSSDPHRRQRQALVQLPRLLRALLAQRCSISTAIRTTAALVRLVRVVRRRMSPAAADRFSNQVKRFSPDPRRSGMQLLP